MKKIIKDKADELDYDNGTIGLNAKRKAAYDKQHPNQTAGYRAATAEVKMEITDAKASAEYEKKTKNMTKK